MCFDAVFFETMPTLIVIVQNKATDQGLITVSKKTDFLDLEYLTQACLCGCAVEVLSVSV